MRMNKKMDRVETVVVFRKFKDGDVLALFPEEKYNEYSGLCMSYQHVGQHGGADYTHCIRTTKSAKPSEYQALKLELERIGYDLLIRTRYTKKANTK